METRDRLLAEALRLFATRGYEAVGVQEIVVAAGVTKPPLYHHFGSKEGLLKSLLQERYEELFATLMPSLEYRGDLPMTLLSVAQAFFGFAQSNRDFYRLQLALGFSGPESVACQAVVPYFGRQHALLEDLFKSVVSDHGNLRGHHEVYATTFLGHINAAIANVERGGREANDQTVRQVVKLFMYGIYAL